MSFRPRPLAQHLLRQLLLAYLLLALGLSALQVVVRYEEDRAKVMRTLESLADTFSPGLTNALWVLEDNLLNSFSNGLKNDPAVASVLLTSSEGEVLVRWEAGSKRPPSAGLRVTRTLLWKVSADDQRWVGTLTLTSSDADLAEALWLNLGRTTLSLFGLLLGVVALLWGLLRRQVAVPLRLFAGQVDDLIRSPERRLMDWGEQRIAEIDSLKRNFNLLVGQLLTRQEEVERDNSQLEERVRERTRDLEQAKEAAEEASRAKGQFLANVSHEIRTPMNAILGFTHLVEATALNDVQSDYIGKIHQSAESLLHILNDILDFSKIDAGKLELVPSDFRLTDVVAATLDLVRFDAERKGVAVAWSASSIPEFVRADRLRLGQVLSNLVTNAVKFTAQGRVSIEVGVDRAADRGALCRFTVIDTGIGLSEEHQKRLFQAFSQADNSITRRYGGTGLGLVISRRLVELMGGTMGFESREGEGSRFWFTAWMDRGDEPLPSPRQSLGTSSNHRGQRVLLVEDNHLNQLLTCELLRKHGLDVTVADNGQIAVELAQSRPFDLVLMDQHMPVMDGLEATRALRRVPQLRDLPIVAVTANVMVGSRDACVAAGMNDFLTKPLVWSELHRVLDRWLPVPPAYAALPDSPPGEAVAYPEIQLSELRERLVEDEDLLRDVLTTYLEGKGVGAVLEAWTAGKSEATVEACHALKGVAANLSLSIVHSAARAAETALAEGRWDEVPPLLKALQEADEQARARVRTILERPEPPARLP